MPTTTLLLIRHGQTDWNCARRIQGHSDRALNPTGHAQAAALLPALKKIHLRQPFSALYSSDLQRALQTAAPIAKLLSLDINQNSQLRERNYGRLEGLDASQQMQQFAPEIRQLKSRDPHYAPPGGESRHAFFARVLQALRVIAAAHPEQHVVVVTHGGSLDAAYRAAADLAASTPRSWPLLNASLNSVQVNNGRLTLQYWGGVKHLGADLQT